MATKHADFGLRQFVKSGSMKPIEAVRRVLDARDFNGIVANDKFLDWAERRIKRDKIEKRRKRKVKADTKGPQFTYSSNKFAGRNGEEE